MKWLYTFIVLSGTFVAVLGITSVNVAMPKMIAPLSTDIYGIQWVSISYLVATAITILVFNHFTNLYGLKKVYLAGIVFFAVGSALSGAVDNIGTMIMARSIQGIGEGFLIPSAQAIIFRIFPPEQRGMAMGMYAMGVAFAPGLGPTVGGYLVEYLSWRWVFYMNLPFIIPIFFASLILLPDFHNPQKHEKPFNYISFGLLATASTSLIILLSRGEKWEWFNSIKTIVFLAIAVLCFLAFLISDLISKHPLIGFDIFKYKEFDYAVITFVLVYGLAFFQILYIMPVYFERIRGLGSFDTGLYIFPFAIGIVLFSPIGGKLSDRLDPKILLLVCQSIIFLDIHFFLSHVDFFTPKLHISFYMLFVGVGMGLFFAPLTALALRHLRQDLVPLGSALYNYARLIGAAAGTSIATNTFTKNTAYVYDNINNMNYTHVQYVYYRLENLKWILNTSLLKAKALLIGLQTLISQAYAVQSVLRFGSFTLAIAMVFTLVLMYIERGKPKT